MRSNRGAEQHDYLALPCRYREEATAYPCTLPTLDRGATLLHRLAPLHHYQTEMILLLEEEVLETRV
jgi:hypothetical protein